METETPSAGCSSVGGGREEEREESICAIGVSRVESMLEERVGSRERVSLVAGERLSTSIEAFRETFSSGESIR